MVTVLYIGVAMTILGLASLPPLALGTVLMFAGMGTLGMGNGSVFQLVPQRFPKEIGVLTGVVGAAGGIGGFFPPHLLGALWQVAGRFAGRLLIFALIRRGPAGGVVPVGRARGGGLAPPGA